MGNSANKINDPIDIPNKFKEYFINLGPKLAAKIKNNTSGATYFNYMGNKNQNSMFFDPIIELKLETEIRNMNPNKSPGYNRILTETIILSAKKISKPLTHITQCFT